MNGILAWMDRESESLIEEFATRDSSFVMSVGEVGRKLPRVHGPRLDIYVRIWGRASCRMDRIGIELIGCWGWLWLLASKHRMGRHGVERKEGRGKGMRTDV